MKLKKMDINIFSNHQEKIIELQKISYISSFEINESEALKLAEVKNKSLKENLIKNSCYLVGIFVKNQLVGFIWFFEMDYFYEQRLHINQIVVDPNYRRRGIAKTLLKAAEDTARKLNIDILDLNVSESNENAINMYANFDFQTERRKMKKQLLD